jgi:raffinose/stachyose/melibiose transport system substrate-binding protein
MNNRFVRTAAVTLLAALLSTTAMAKTAISVLRVEPSASAEKDIYAQIAKDYEALHPDVEVKFEYIANEAYKQKLPTLLQSDARPDIFYSWGGGVMRDQFKAGFLKDITSQVADEWKKTYSSASISAFSVDGKIVGAPINAGEVVFWTNLELAKKAGIDISTIKTWKDFLTAVKKAKAAGITPIILGGKDKWPVQFYYGYLAVRAAGMEGFEAAMSGEGEGFASPEFIRAGKAFKELVDLDPFQPGFMSTSYEQASGSFGDGKALFDLMGDWEYQGQKDRSLDKKGIADEKLGLLRFPALEGGKGAPTDTFGGINGWLVSASASEKAVEFLAFMNSEKYQAKAAAQGIFIPTAIAASAAIENPFFKTMAEDLSASTYHQIFLDQALGADVGATANDTSADLAQGAISPENAAKSLQDAWSFKN